MNWRDFLAPGAVGDELMGVPFASSDARARRAAATIEGREILSGVRMQLKDLDQQIHQPRLMRRTRDRLKALRDGTQEHLGILEELFRPLGTVPFSEANHALGQARAGFALLRYYEHLFRDWSWGAKENKASLELTKALPWPEAAKKPKRVLVLGAGACRFPYELHRWLKPELTLCVDLNPLLLACAARIVRGEKLELMELPSMPADVGAQVKRVTLACDAPLKEGFEVLVNDLEDWALKDASFDLVVTHWVMDAVPMPPAQLFSLINRALVPNGHWLNVGPTGFNTRVLAQNYARDEVVDLAERCELEVLGSQLARVPYFQNPSSAHWRTEQVFAFIARKKGECSEAPGEELPHLPEWLERTTRSPSSCRRT